MATNKPKRGAEGPKKSVAKPTAAQSAAAKKKAAVKKSAAEGPKRSTSKPSATAMASAKSKPKVVESGVGNIPATIARLGVAIAKQVGRTGSQPKALPEKTIREAAEFQKLMGQQSARTAAASARQTAARKTQVGKETAEKRQSVSSSSMTERDRIANRLALEKQAKIKRANAVNKTLKKK